MPTKEKTTTEITQPVGEVRLGEGNVYRIYVLLDGTQKFRMPGCGDNSPRAWDYGPSLILEQDVAGGLHTRTMHQDDPQFWGWLTWLAGVGSWALNDEQIVKSMPEGLRNQPRGE